MNFETNVWEKLSSDEWRCEKDWQDDYCLEKVVEKESKCYLPWGLGLGADRAEWCMDALSLDNTMRRMPDDRTMSKSQLIEHITNLGCSVSCTYIAYNPMLVLKQVIQDLNKSHKS